jgi:hypothetical protein
VDQPGFSTFAGLGRVFLSGQDVRFFPDGAVPDGRVICVNGRPADTFQLSLANDEEKYFLHWLAPLEQIADHPTLTINPHLLDPLPPDGKVAARVFLESGRLRTIKTVVSPVSFHPQPTTDVPGSLALELAFEMDFSRFAEVHLTSFGDGSQARRLVLASDRNIEIFIENLEADSIKDPDLDRPPTPRDSTIDVDFSAHYGLCSETPGSQPLPIAAGAAGTLNRLCSPATVIRGGGH